METKMTALIQEPQLTAQQRTELKQSVENQGKISSIDPEVKMQLKESQDKDVSKGSMLSLPFIWGSIRIFAINKHISFWDGGKR